jgi:hypothetical protein
MDIFQIPLNPDQCLNPCNFFFSFFSNNKKYGYFRNFDTTPLGFNRNFEHMDEIEKK